MISTGGTTTLGLYDNKSDIQKLQQDLAYEVSRSTAIDLDLTAKVESASGGKYGFITLSDAQAAQASLPANSVVEVTNDTTSSNNGTYQWNGADLTKSAYDPLTQSKKFTQSSLNESIVKANGSDLLLSTENRSFAYVNGSAVGANVQANIASEGISIITNSATTSVVLSTPLVLRLNEPCIISHKFKFIEASSAQFMSGLTFNSGANLRNVNIRNDGTIYTTDTASTTKMVLAAAVNQAKFNINEIITCSYFWSGTDLEVQVSTVNGTTAKYKITELSNLQSAVQINQRGVGTTLQYSPIRVEIRDNEVLQSVAAISSNLDKSTSITGLKQDFTYSANSGIVNSNGTATTGATLALSGSDLVFDVTTSSSRNVVFATSLLVEDEAHYEIELNFQITALTGTSARFVGISLGDGANRRHYVWQGTGGVIEYNDADVVLSTIATTSASRAYDVNSACKMKLTREADSSATLKLYVNNVIVASLPISNVPAGKVYICARAAPIVTYKFTSLTINGYNSSLVNALKAVPQGTYAKLVNQISVPDTQAVPSSVIGGFTCTGAQQIGSTGKWAGCWVVGNHGQTYEGSSVYAPSIVLLSPDRTKKLNEWDMSDISGIQSIQGVVWDSSDDTIWFVDKTNRIVRHIDFTGTLLSDSIAAPVDYTRINGIAYNPTLDALYVQNEGVKQIKLISCADGVTVLGTWTSLSAAADQFYYYAEKNWLLYSYGDNGVDGQLHVMDLTHDKILSIITLKGSQSIEGVCIANNGNLVAFNDGGYHTVAKPPLNISCEYQINFDF